jgi:hypothetical protein
MPAPLTTHEHLDVIQSITNLHLRVTREFVEGRQHTIKIKASVDARHVPEAGYGNLADGGNVSLGEAETFLLHPTPIRIVEGDIHERVSDSLRVMRGKSSICFFARNRVRLLVRQLTHD